MRNKTETKVPKGVVALLFCILACLGILILWMGIPILAANQFGPAANSLSQTQKWNYSLQLLKNGKSLKSSTCQSPMEIDFAIEPGDSISQIAANLRKDGLVDNSELFRSYLIYKGLDTQIRAGNYRLDCSMSLTEIADSIKNNYQEYVVFNILAGWRAEEIAAALPSSGIEVSPDEFLAVVQKPTDLVVPSYLPAGTAVEGFLFPGEYQIKRDVSANELVKIFLDRFNQQIPESVLAKASLQGLTPYQVIILASIVQRETYAEEERATIASVFYNRLSRGMKLETDPTVQYTLGYDVSWGWWKSPLKLKDLQIQSEYNTYQIPGLPPAPISNPDLSSINAVISPAETDYLYFRARCDNSGYHLFARTFEEHLANECK